MSHVFVPDAEEILDQEFKVLDKGFVRLVDYMGGDDRVVASARVSYGKGTKQKREDKALIFYLMEHEHMSPFEQVILTFHVKLPIVIARQFIRHRTFRYNEISGRYSEMKDEYYVPDVWREPSKDPMNKQGSVPMEYDVERKVSIEANYEGVMDHAFHNYKEILKLGVSREMARMVLPLATYTEWYMQCDLRNLLHFLKLRLDEHAQWEAQQYAKEMLNITKKVAPLSVEAWEKFVLKIETTNE